MVLGVMYVVAVLWSMPGIGRYVCVSPALLQHALPNVSAGTYYSTLALVGWYTSGLGYLVSTMPVVLLMFATHEHKSPWCLV
jgi:uncharacterized membrane protein YesL